MIDFGTEEFRVGGVKIGRNERHRDFHILETTKACW